MKRKSITTGITSALVAGGLLLAGGAGPAMAAEPSAAQQEATLVAQLEEASLTFDVDSMAPQSKTTVLEDGTEVTVSATRVLPQPGEVVSAPDGTDGVQALSGTWKIKATNVISTMKYEANFVKAGSYTKIDTITNRVFTCTACTYDELVTEYARKTETRSYAADARVITNIKYGAGIRSAVGGARVQVKSNKVTASLV